MNEIMHQACCAQAAGPASLDGNRYRLMHYTDGPVKGPCADHVEPQGQCQAEMQRPRFPTEQCPLHGRYQLRTGEGSLLLCAHHYRRHHGGETLWVYLPPL